jgi:hypothetical protein
MITCPLLRPQNARYLRRVREARRPMSVFDPWRSLERIRCSRVKFDSGISTIESSIFPIGKDPLVKAKRSARNYSQRGGC